MGLRRIHSKSRLGCSQCKRRRIKCDECPPCCGNCAAKGIACDYQHLRPAIENLQLFTPEYFRSSSQRPKTALSRGSVSRSTFSAFPVSGGSTPSSVSTCGPTDLEPTDTIGFDLHDLGLLHYFTMETATTLPACDCEQYRTVWQHDVPQLAISHGFLMHSVIAFAAAHRWTTNRTPWCREAAQNHFSEALNLFRTQVEAVTSDKTDALYIFSILICFLSLYIETDKLCRDPIAEVVSLLRTIHTSIGIVKQIEHTLQTTPIGRLRQHTRSRRHHVISPAASESIDLLEGIATKHTKRDSAEGDASSRAISKLRQFYTLVEPHPTDWSNILSWPISLDPDFISLLEARDPLALCTLAQWCVPACNAPTKWWVGGFFTELLSTIALRLGGTEFEEAMAWPVSEGLTNAGT